MLRSDYNVNETKPKRVASDVLFADIPIDFISHPHTKDIRPITDTNAVKQAVKILVLTNFSDRPFRPDLGGNVTSYLFENATEFTGLAIRDEILRVIRKNEPRVINPKVIVELDEDRNQLLVTIAFTIKLSHEQTEISFFLDRIR